MTSSITPRMDDASIQATLLSLKDLFFNSLCNGTHLSDFDQSWTQFCGTVGTCADHLSDDTWSMIFSFSSTITTVIPGLLEVESTGDHIRQQLQEDISRITGEEFSKLAITDPQSEGPYVKSAHAWLLDNLHNPYPSLEIRAHIARKHHCLRRNVDAWFVDARKRIGWNSIRKSHFPRKADLISAATRFFKGNTTSSLPPTPSDDHNLIFIDMMFRANSLCLSSRGQESSATGLPKQQREAELSYPSPEHSTNSSPEPPSPLFPESSLLDTDQSRYAWNKPPTFTNGTILQDSDTLDNIPSQKRKLSETVSQLGTQQDCERKPIHQLPSPAPSVNHSPAQATPLTLSSPDDTSTSVSDATVTHSSKRKRCLSDSGSANVAKRHCRQSPLQVDSIASTVTGDDVASYDFCTQVPEPVRSIDFSNELFSIECMSYKSSSEDRELEFPCGPAFDLLGPDTWSLASTDLSKEIGLGLIPFSDPVSGDDTWNFHQNDVDSYWNLGLDLDWVHPFTTTSGDGPFKVQTPLNAPSRLLDLTNFPQTQIQLSDLSTFHDFSSVDKITSSRTISPV